GLEGPSSIDIKKAADIAQINKPKPNTGSAKAPGRILISITTPGPIWMNCPLTIVLITEKYGHGTRMRNPRSSTVPTNSALSSSSGFDQSLAGSTYLVTKSTTSAMVP